jgi:hypothetical protein
VRYLEYSYSTYILTPSAIASSDAGGPPENELKDRCHLSICLSGVVDAADILCRSPSFICTGRITADDPSNYPIFSDEPHICPATQAKIIAA